MISEDTLQSIAHIFCGDVEGYYSYKSGGKLVTFFNSYCHHNDQYGQGFPSRWAYVYDRIMEFIDTNAIDRFITYILSKEYIMQDCNLSQVEAAERSQEIFTELNRLLQKDMYVITRANGEFYLRAQNDDLEYIGNGGFAIVYRQKSTGLIMKKLKDDYLTDRGIRSRFKREYEITKSLRGIHGIIEVYTFDESACTYTMEEAGQTLEHYLAETSITDDIRTTCLRQIMYIMTEVHKRDIIHRDLSPNNIFIIRGMLKIADFGLGKDLNVFTSHRTLYTNCVGQYYYCAPEQFMLLRDGDKRSDVYSLGRIINYVMTGSPINSHHIYRSVSEKASNTDAAYRYADAGQLYVSFEKSVEFHKRGENETAFFTKIASKQFDSEVEAFIYELPPTKISQIIFEGKSGIKEALLSFMRCDDAHAQHVIQSVESTYQNVCGRSFAAYDPFAHFAFLVLQGDFTFVVKEIAANILRYVATDVNRFSAQHYVEEIKQKGIEPLLEEILDS